jgi:hypothetical protein
MKKLLLSMAAVALLFTACDNDKNEIVQEQEIDMSDFYVYTDFNEDLSSKSAISKEKFKTCYSMAVLNKQLDANPGLAKKMYNVEYQTRKFITAKGKPTKPGSGGGGGGEADVDVLPIDDGLGIIEIPVHVNVLYNNQSQNVSDNQIQAQIDVLNEDFRKLNPDASLLPSSSTFGNDITDSEIKFVFDSTTDITRKSTSVTAWSTNDDMKKSSRGGIDPLNPNTTLNIWVCNISGGILGYAQFPGGESSTDGVVILYSSLPGGSAAPYNLGRTATHEVGHYLNLRHIWGDGRCNRDDFVTDTPLAGSANYGCPSFPSSSCKTTDMTMNYMDYTDDACMYMFTDGQRNRMRAILANGASRGDLKL